MNTLRMVFRNLAFFRASSVAVVAGMAVATAVLAGALLVGDSVTGSLAELAGRRLGPVDVALVGPRLFDQSLARRVAAKAGNPHLSASAALIVTGGASSDPHRAGDVQILAVGTPSSGGTPWVSVGPHACLLNREVAQALGVSLSSGDGGPIVLSFPSMAPGSKLGIVARRDREHAVQGLRLDSSRVDPAEDMAGLFNLAGGQRAPRNVWLNLADLQGAVGQPDKANTLLVHDDGPAANDPAAGAALAKSLDEALRGSATLADYGLTVKPAGEGEAALSSDWIYIPTPALEAAQKAAASIGVSPQLVAVNLVNAAVRIGADGKPAAALHYFIAAGINQLDGAPIKDDEIVFNEATAEQLGVKVGDAIRLDFYRRAPDGELAEHNSSQEGIAFHVAKIIPMTGIGADRTLTPTLKGLTDADSVAHWDAPAELKIDTKLAAKDNDAYWKKYKAAPRLFVSLAASRKMWGGVYGDVTSVRVPGDKATAFADALRGAIDPASLGLVFRPVRAQQIAAASSGGAAEFGWLFVGLSFFLIAAAALLVAMLFRLNIEQRARQIGLMAAVGFSPRKLRRIATLEGLTLAVVGGVIGLVGAIGYSWLMMAGLRTWWVGAVGTSALRLFVSPESLAYGLIGGIFVAWLAVLWAVWRVGRTPAARLLAGAWNAQGGRRVRAGRATRLIGAIIVLLGIVLLALIYAGVIADPTNALYGGALLLAGALCWLGGSLRPGPHGEGRGLSSVARLGVRNASRHTARSVLSAGLIASAVFTLVIVAAMRQSGAADASGPHSGSGGYQLFIRAGVPLMGDLDTKAGRAQLDIADDDNPLWSKSRFVCMRRWAGEDVSCLNLMRPSSPTILAVPDSLIEQNRFTFASSGGENPWKKLLEPATAAPAGGPIVVPVIADDQTAQYILNLKLGDSMPFTDPAGRKCALKLVATLEGSIFQSEVLMGEANFRSLFPSEAGFGVVLAQTDPKDVVPLEQLLNKELGADYALSVDTTAARLASYNEIVNTYLSTFQMLGSLGLMLGTIGLAIVLLRNVIERRPELALLGALGFGPGKRSNLILSENAFLLVLGLLVGTGCAILGVLPTVLSGRGKIAVGPLALTLAAVLVIGLAASVIAVRISGLRSSPADLRSE